MKDLRKQSITYYILTVLSIVMIVLVNIMDTLQMVDLFFYMYTTILFGSVAAFFAYASYDTYKQFKKEDQE